MKKFEYVGKANRNISHGGVSFPVVTGCVISAEEGWLFQVLPEKQLRERPTDTKAKYIFPKRSVGIFPKDPTGGLPMRSVEGRTRPEGYDRSPGVIKDTLEKFNPYELPKGPEDDVVEKGRKLEVTTSPGEPPKPKVKDKGATTESVVTADGPPFMEPPTEKPVTPKEEQHGPAFDAPTKTALRKENKAELLDRVSRIVEEGAPLKKEILDPFQTVDMDTHKGPIFELLMKYYDLEK